MDINNKQNMSDLLAYLRGLNCSSVSLPAPSGQTNSTDEKGVYPATWWDELIEDYYGYNDYYIGARIDGTDLAGYKAVIDGSPATLVVLSYDNRDPEGVVLVDDHLALDDLVDAWLGNTDLAEHEGHVILEYAALTDARK